jgi:ATP-dependent helicase HrpA
VKQDIDAQLQRLFCADFVVRGGFDRLGSYPRYLDALLQRLAKAPFMGPKDEDETVRIARYVQRIQISETSADSDLHWLIEEYRVSVFAQGLKTKVPVSPQRIDKAFSKAGL